MGKNLILIKNQSSIIINILNNAFVIITISKNDNVNVYQKNITFNVRRLTFKYHTLNMKKSFLNAILKVNLIFILIF